LREKEKKLAKLKKEKEITKFLEEKECTFRPQIKPYKRTLRQVDQSDDGHRLS
jgi:hypothetical protein